MLKSGINDKLIAFASERLIAGIMELGLKFNDMQVRQLLAYTWLLQKWNKVYSLTAITDLDAVIKYHLLDGLAIIQQMKQYRSLLDVGSGMGIPGVVIAICCPAIQVTLLDSNSKKTAFLRQVAIELDLKNVTVVGVRVENFEPLAKFDAVISRAFSDALTFIQLTHLLVKKYGNFLLMKSQKIQTEVEKIADYKYWIIPLSIPGIDDLRYLLKIEAK